MRTLVLLAVLTASHAAAATYRDDSLVVRGILDTNGWLGTKVTQVTRAAEGRIVSLYFQGRDLRVLPASVAQLDLLRSLDISWCGLTVLPREISQLGNLRILRLAGTKLLALPEWIGDLVNLEKLYAANCALQEVPEAIRSLQNLRLLDLSGNALTILPAWIASLAGLEYLDLERNHLVALPEAVGDMPGLNVIHLSNNLFREFPGCLTEVTNIYAISMDSNAIITVPVSIGNLERLGSLSLRSNELVTLPGSFTRVGRRVGLFLFIDDNRLCSLPDSIEAWIDQTTPNVSLWDWRTTQRCAQSAVSPPAIAPVPDRALSVVRQGAGNLGRIEYQVSTGPVRIEVWNAAGGLVCVLVDRFHAPGTHTVSLSGTQLAGGTYMIRMVSDSWQLVRRILIRP